MVEHFSLTTQPEQLPGFDLLVEGKFVGWLKRLLLVDKLQTLN